jgi:hypothetical protein
MADIMACSIFKEKSHDSCVRPFFCVPAAESAVEGSVCEANCLSGASQSRPTDLIQSARRGLKSTLVSFGGFILDLIVGWRLGALERLSQQCSDWVASVGLAHSENRIEKGCNPPKAVRPGPRPTPFQRFLKNNIAKELNLTIIVLNNDVKIKDARASRAGHPLERRRNARTARRAGNAVAG